MPGAPPSQPRVKRASGRRREQQREPRLHLLDCVGPTGFVAPADEAQKADEAIQADQAGIQAAAGVAIAQNDGPKLAVLFPEPKTTHLPLRVPRLPVAEVDDAGEAAGRGVDEYVRAVEVTVEEAARAEARYLRAACLQAAKNGAGLGAVQQTVAGQVCDR